MIRVALTMLGRGRWTGGEVYLVNMLTVIRERLADSITPVLFLTPEENERFGTALAPLLPEPATVDVAVARFGREAGLRAAVATGCDAAAAAAFASRGCTLAFEPALFFGWRFPLPAIAWMPDFQHKYMPEMFPWRGWLRREAGFRAQIASKRTVMLSSETARRDVERMYPAARGRTAVVRFAQAIDIAGLVALGAELRALYCLPERFVFLPGQFWKHKNHALVARALAAGQAAGAGDRLPLVVMSGRQDDARNPGAYEAFTAQLAAAGAVARVKHLGLIPYDHVLGLTATADAMLNPSYFEGWSTPVEEAKALGTPLIISGIAIHREQAPHARFIDPDSPDDLLAALLEVSDAPPRQRHDVPALVAAQDARVGAYADQLHAAFERAVSAGRR